VVAVVDTFFTLHTLIDDDDNREVDILKRVQHPNIVKLYEVFQADDLLLLVMEYIKGEGGIIGWC